MRVGVFSDAHDHVDNVRRAIVVFNQLSCDLVLFAGDFVSPLVIPPLRKLTCPVVACFGDNDGNRVGIAGGMRIVGTLGDPPFGIGLPDGTKILLTHQLEAVRRYLAGANVIIWAHTHKPSIAHDAAGRLLLNPGETSGWVFRKPTVAWFDSVTLHAEIVKLPELGSPPVIEPY
ncbi:MAG: YfcE family phosphodiesterase [Planctomycetaceae bacterium]|nr:YfcE family phosphodiesterase [Planctomycetaceae bacterium]